jgi:hypothetical protein
VVYLNFTLFPRGQGRFRADIPAPGAFINGEAFGRVVSQLGKKFLGFGIRTPATHQAATLEKNDGPYALSVVE